jgi:carbamate kinase
MHLPSRQSRTLVDPRKAHNRTVLTLGGNALIRPGETGSVQEQWERAAQLAKFIRQMAPEDELILTHGNGPQVGRILLRSDLCSETISPVPIDVAVAATQGQMGIMLQQCLESFAKRKSATILTQVLVNADDPAFLNPEKFIGRFYSKTEAMTKASSLGWTVKEDPGRGWRRVVASPRPYEIVESDSIMTLLNAGITVIACGGGGVPVIRHEGHLVGVEAVVDKDRSSALLAHVVEANRMICLTGVDAVMLDFATPKARPLRQATLSEIAAHLDEGQFPEGSMAPKIRAAMQFLIDGGKCVIITSPERLPEALLGKAGTLITQD